MTYMLVILVIMIALTGLLLAFTPWLQRKNECFAVTVPESAQRDVRLCSMKKRYSLIVSVTTVLCALIIPIAFVANPDFAAGDGGVLLAALMTIACLIPCVVSFSLMLTYRKQVQKIKQTEGWIGEHAQESAVVVAEELPRPVSLVWNILYVPVILVTLGVGIVGYGNMPDMVPMHMDFAGNINSWAPKSFKVVLFPCAVQAFMVLVLVLCHWSIVRSKRPTDPWSPATSALAYGMFARAQSVLILATGLLLSLVVGLTFQLSALGVMTLMTSAIAITGAALLMVVASILVSVVYGQAGSRVFKRMQESDSVPFDDDSNWKLGVFYCNPEDSSVFLPERFGVGWTINLARPAAWMFLVGIVAITLIFLVLIFVLVG